MARTGVVLLAGLLAVCLTGGAALAQSPVKKKSCSQGGVCKIGDRGPGGGIVFITPETKSNATGKYFEAALGSGKDGQGWTHSEGWSGGINDPVLPWCWSPSPPVDYVVGYGRCGDSTYMLAGLRLTSTGAHLRRM